MRLLVSLTAFLMLSAGGPLLAQDMTDSAEAEISEIVQQGTIRLSSADGAQTQDYPLESFSLSSSFSATYDGHARTEISLSLSLTATPDEFLLDWMRLGQGEEGSRTLVIETGSIEDEASRLVYEMDEARVTSFSVSGGYPPAATSIALQVYTSSLRINGIPLS